jgi:hypothetical protein
VLVNGGRSKWTEGLGYHKAGWPTRDLTRDERRTLSQGLKSATEAELEALDLLIWACGSSLSMSLSSSKLSEIKWS